jgi:acid phosphatase family membrane protein YuiD
VSSTENQPSGRAALVEALHVRQNLKRGVAAGVAFTAIVFLFFVVLAPSTVRSPVYYVALAFVLAMTSSGLAAALLVMRRAYKLTRDL